MKLNSKTLIGAVAGDVIGAPFEGKGRKIKSTDFELFSEWSKFTDDTILTIAVADAILHDKDFAYTIQDYARRYPHRGYGGYFRKWIYKEPPLPYGSYGNGSAMRVSPVGFAFNDLETVLQKAKQSAEVTHNHPEGIKGAQAVASVIFLARGGINKEEIRKYIRDHFGQDSDQEDNLQYRNKGLISYKLDFTIDAIRSDYKFDASCPGSVPAAIVAFLESTDYENAIRLAISLGGDSDTLAAMTGAMAIAYYKTIPDYIVQETEKRLPEEFIKIMNEFDEAFGY